MKSRFVILSILFLCILLRIDMGFAQISVGGIPPGYQSSDADEFLKTLHFTAPDLATLKAEDEVSDKAGIAFRMGITIPTAVTPDQWIKLPDGRFQWRVKIVLPGALATALYYENFFLPLGFEMFVYSSDRSELIGAFTKENHTKNGLFATSLIRGEEVIVECVGNKDPGPKPLFVISEILFAYRGIEPFPSSIEKSADGSGECEVNVNCSEGAQWQDQKQGVVRVLSKISGSGFWCTGSLVNNTRIDFSPYLLTADHCARNGQGTYATATDLDQWMFYFNYESPTCSNPGSLPELKSMIGATFKASTAIDTGSDFYLLLLNQEVPQEYTPYYNGWSRSDIASPSGVSIHHPSGDIKKISTYTSPLVTAYWNDPSKPYFWRVQWAATQNGHGVTEGGSSGSPIFTNDGLISGQLTGGQASCSSPTAPDYYGKLSMSWQSFGTTPDKQLKYWLDPDNTGVASLPGTYNTRDVIAGFTVDTTVITVGNRVNFSDLSSNSPTSWKWLFQGGTPAEASGRYPEPVIYSTFGKFDVTLIAGNDVSSDTLIKKKFIRVIPGLFPNPAQKFVQLLLGSHEEQHLSWELTDPKGRVIETGIVDITELFMATIDFRREWEGIFVLSVVIGDKSTAHYKLVIRK